MTSPTDAASAAPVDEDRLSAAQIALIIALVDTQSRLRLQLTDAAVRAVLAAFKAIADWWSADAVNKAIDRALRVVQPNQRQLARITDAYLARVASIITGRTVSPAGSVDITRLRRSIPESVLRGLVDGDLRPQVLQLGEHDPVARRVIPGPDLDAEQRLVVPEPSRRRARDDYLAVGAAYGRVADQYRFGVVANGDTTDGALAKALVRVEAVARTDMTLAVREQVRRTLGNIRGVTGYRRILRPELSETGPCGLCVVAADRTYKVEHLMPIHDRCVPTGTRVAAEGVRALTRRWYSGSLVILLTASGEELTITANHPVLTDQGWIPAHLVKEGDHVVRHRTGHGVVARSPDEGDGPPRVEDLWRAAVMTGTLLRSRVPVAPEDFHGDWSKGEVEVVSPYGLLSRVGDVSFVQPERELALMGGHRAGIPLAGQGTPGQAGFICGHAAAGVQGRLDLSLPLVGSDPGVVQAQGFGQSPARYAGGGQAVADAVAVQSVLLRQRELGNAGQVLCDDLFVRNVLPQATRFDPAFTKFAGQGRHTYAELGRNLRHRLTGHVELDRVIHQRRVEGTHEVYNLHTVEGWYSANNLIVSNCVCDVLPVIGDADPGLNLNASDLRRIYEAAGGTGGEVRGRDGRRHSAALKRIRVALGEHGEIGPVLFDADQNYRGLRDVAPTLHPDRQVRDRAKLAAFTERLDVLLARQGRGERGLERAIEWQTERVEQLRRELARQRIAA